MQLVTGTNYGYFGRMGNYLESLKDHAHLDFWPNLVGIGFMPEYKGISCHMLTREQNEGAPPQTECIQHGSFLHVLRGKGEEVILYTDGDFIMQRPLDDSETKLLELKDYEVVTSWNGGASETLMLEATRLSPNMDYPAIIHDWGRLVEKAPIYNVGFIAMTRNTWRELYQNYMHDWEAVCATFRHQARQQWLISFEIAAMDLRVKIAPWSLHAHGHFGLKPGMTRNGDGIYHDGKKAAFRHYL